MKHEPLRYAHDEGHTDVCFSEDGQKFITCGADGDIRIWSTEDREDPVHNCVGESASSVAQNGDKIYVSTGNNDVQILSLPDGERQGVLDRFTAPVNQITISKNKNLMALASEAMEVKLIYLDKPGETKLFSGLLGPCLSVAISPNAEYLAASSGDSKLRIWHIENSNLVAEFSCFKKVNSFANAKVLCRIDFEPVKGQRLAYPDQNKIVLLNVSDWSEAASLTCEEVSADFSIVQYSPCGKYILASSTEGDFVIWEVTTEAVFKVSKHEKSIAICGLVWNPSGTGDVVYTDIEGQLGIIANCIEKSAVCSRKEPANIVEEVDENGFMENDVDFDGVQFEDEDDDDNENAVSVEKLKRQCLGSPDPELQSIMQSSRGPTPRPRTPEVPLQDPFMPTSTPEHLDPRYLCWNHVGIIRSYGNNSDNEGASKSIEVEFHDATFHNSMMLSNYHNYTMGSLSSAALVIASLSQIQVIPLNAVSKEWTLKVEEHEEIILVTASENLICFSMSNYVIRIASIFGTQRGIVSIPGPAVSMAAFRYVLMVAYHSGNVRKNDQCINVKLIRFEGLTIDSKELGSALGPQSTLSWLGFSDMGTPGMTDSLGMLSLYPPKSNTWIPFCDTAKHNKSLSDSFFVTAIFESYRAVGGIKCKGGVYPGFTPHPTVCEIPLEPPFAEATTDKSQMEMNLFTWHNLGVADTHRQIQETALKVFALACKNNFDQRALEFMEILGDPQVLKLGLRYATKLEKKRLAQKLTELASKLNEENDEQAGVSEVTMPEPSTITPMPKKLTLSFSKYGIKQKSQAKEVVMKESRESQENDSVKEENRSLQESAIETQTSMLEEESENRPRNPFLKSLKKPKVDPPNPLGLTDKFAGVNYQKEVKNKLPETSGKRKLSDLDSDKQKGKQKRLDSFKFKPKKT